MAPVFSRILLAYDDSAAAQIALAYACALMRKDTTLTVVHTMRTSAMVASATSYSGFAGLDPSPLIEALDERGAELLQAAVAACASHNVIADHVFLRDSAAAGLVEFSRTKHADLIVTGTHGYRGVTRALLGSFAEDLLRSSDAPVLVVNGYAKAPQSEPVFARALVALDDSPPAQTAMAIAVRMSDMLLTQLTLCNVIDSRELLSKAGTYGYDERPFEKSLHTASMELLSRAAKTNPNGAPIADLVVVEGEPAHSIEHTAMQRNCDLVIMGSHGRSGLPRLLLGSVAEAVVRSSSVPVLVTPAAEGQAY